MGRRPSFGVTAAVSAAAVGVLAWVAYTASWKGPLDQRITNTALSTTGRWLAAGTLWGRITIWDRVAGSGTRTFEFPGGVLNDLAFGPDENVLAVAGRNLGMYEMATARLRTLRSDGRNYGTVRFNSSGDVVVVVAGDGAIEVIDWRSGATHSRMCCSTIGGEVAFTPDGAGIVNAGHWPGLWDAHSGRLIAQLTSSRQFQTFCAIAFDHTRDRVLMGSQDGRVYAWDLTTRQLVARSAPHPEYVTTIAVLGGWIALAGAGGPLRLWNPDTGHEEPVASAHPESNVIASPDGNSVVFGTRESVIEFWHLRPPALLQSLDSRRA